MRLSKKRGISSGTVIILSSMSIPQGWLLCNGDSYDKQQYSELFLALGGESSPYGFDSSNFSLPDLRGEFVRGLDNGKGIDNGRELGTNQGEQEGEHSHLVGSISLTSPPPSPSHTHSITANSGPLNHTHTFPTVFSNAANPIGADPDPGDRHPSIFGYPWSWPGSPRWASWSPSDLPHTHALTVSATPTPHSHGIPAISGGLGMQGGVYDPMGWDGNSPNTGVDETRPRNVSMNYIIKV